MDKFVKRGFAKSSFTCVLENMKRTNQSIDSKTQLESFDLDWKKSRTRIPEMTYNFKRIERYNHAKPPVFSKVLDIICGVS